MLRGPFFPQWVGEGVGEKMAKLPFQGPPEEYGSWLKMNSRGISQDNGVGEVVSSVSP